MHRIHRIIPRMYSTLTQTPSTPILEKLQDRAIIRLRGVDAAPFLQGLITNDMQHLVRGASSMYTMFLNKQGRVLYDAIVYKEFSTNDFMIECDSKVVDDLCGHLKLYRIRKKITVEKETDQDVWALFHPEINIEKSLTKDVKSTEKIQCYVDPRMKYLGTRIIVPKDFSAIENELQNTKITKGSGSDYREHRYRLGVGEGISDLPPEKCFPLEANCDYMHGVSFHKGCYLGQELTARTYHTGIIRKRLMPLDLLSTIQVNDDTKVILPDGKNVGKVRGVQGCVGLALLRIEQVLKADDLTVNQIKCSTLRPHWWPEEAPIQIIKK